MRDSTTVRCAPFRINWRRIRRPPACTSRRHWRMQVRPGDQLVLGASNPVRDTALVGLNTQGVLVRSNRGVARYRRDDYSPRSVRRWRTTIGRTLALDR